MSGNSYDIACHHCGATNQLRGKAFTLALTCKSCHHYFCTGQWNKTIREFTYIEEPVIPIGSKGKFDGYLYEVLGFVVKQETKYKYRWREYLLFNPYRGFAFLSEYNGHWNFIWPVEIEPEKDHTAIVFSHNLREYRLYQQYAADVVYAKGEFFFDVVDITESTTNYEYIAPPYLLALERSEDSILWCEGEYLSREGIARAFSAPIDKLPPKKGIGYTQPLEGSFSNESLIIVSVMAFVMTAIIQLMLNNWAEKKTVFQWQYADTDMVDQKTVVTKSFELHERSQSLELYLYAPLSNDWFFSEFTLVEETTGTEYNFTKELEYYSGYEDGTSWSEGSRSGTAILSQVPAGKYHINIYPQFSPGNSSFSLMVTRDVPLTGNFWITCLGFFIFPAFHFIRMHYRQRKRWSDSDYSPYHTE